MTPQVFRSTDTNAPAITNTVGDLTTALDAILVTGYGLQTITSLTHSAGVITGTLVGHGYSVGDVITISGAIPDEYNGRVTIASVADADHFTYAPVGSNPGSSPATGTVKGSIHGGTPGLGWELAFTGSNVRSYRPRAGSRMYLGVDHSVNAYNARFRGFETMSAAGVAVASGTGPYPTDAQVSGGLYAQTTINSAGARPWKLFGDDRGFKMHINVDAGANDYWNSWEFGDFESFKPSDIYNSLVGGKTSSVTVSTGDNFLSLSAANPSSTATAGYYMPRGYTGSGGSQTVAKVTDSGRHTSTLIGGRSTSNTTLNYPDDISGTLQLSKLYLSEGGNHGLRGSMRGLWNICHAFGDMLTAGVANGDTFAGQSGLAALTFEICRLTSASGIGACAYDLTGPWS